MGGFVVRHLIRRHHLLAAGRPGDGFGLEQQRPAGSDIALRSDVRESELRLQREIAELRAEVQKDIAELRADVQRDVSQLQASIERTKTDLLKWIVPLMLGQVAALAALVKLL